jgi:lysophospholipase L1-like esterase
VVITPMFWMTQALRSASRFFLLVLPFGAVSLFASDDLHPGDVVAICGDSITEQGLYSAMIEAYLLACQPVSAIRTHQFGLSGETSWEFLHRIDSDVLPFRPTVATTCYGMNDGAYGPVDPERETAYRRATTEIVQRLKRAGVRLIVVGSPGAVDSDAFDKNVPIWTNAEEYNRRTLRGLAQIAREVAAEQGVRYADVHEYFCQVMERAKAKFGPRYHVAGADGVHPAANGHLIIAYAFLKALGCDGNIGTFTIDLAAKRATLSDGHRLLSFVNDTVEIESARYPFCFYGDPNDPDSTRGILEVLPFNAELNRLQLIVTGAPSGRVKVMWGKWFKIFRADELARGVNLAAEFLDNPFAGTFKELQHAVSKQQQFEATGDQGIWRSLTEGWRERESSSDEATLERVRELEAAARAAVKPVRHSLTITPVP